MEHMIGICVLVTVCIIAAMAIMLIQSKRWMAKQMTERETYIVRSLPLYTGIMVFGIVFWMVLTWVFILAEGPDIEVMLILLAIMLFFLLGYFCILFWGIVVQEDKGMLVYYRPPLPPKQIRISDITKVQFLENRLNSTERYRIRVLQHDRKLFEVSDDMQNFYLLAEYLSENEANATKEPDLYKQYDCGKYTVEEGYFRQGGIETAELTDDFSVMEPVSERVRSGVPTLFLLIISILSVCNWREWSRGEPYYFLYFAVVLLLTLWGMKEFISQMFRKISVCNHKIRVRNGIGRVRIYDVGEISAVERKRHYLILYAGGNKIAKVSKDDTNFASFEEWLYRELEQVSQNIQDEET
ncbi:MAG: hypothetical protein K2H45_01395 [Acetatifactor sp.]|nr:hypothetical protein [Acetatifactor sp.]